MIVWVRKLICQRVGHKERFHFFESILQFNAECLRCKENITWDLDVCFSGENHRKKWAAHNARYSQWQAQDIYQAWQRAQHSRNSFGANGGLFGGGGWFGL